MKTIFDLYTEESHNPELRHRRLREFWLNPPAGSRPEDYARAPECRSNLVVSLVQALPVRPRTIMEVGCNVGRNLNAMVQAGYKWPTTSLVGVDARNCEAESDAAYPGLSLAAIRVWSPAEQFLPQLTQPYDLIFTMATLQHLPPGPAGEVVRQMARLAGRYIITIEDETRGWPLHFPRRYDALFEMLDWRQVVSHPADLECGEDRYVVRVFEK